MKDLPKLLAAFCTYQRAERLPSLIRALRCQSCTVPYGILVVNNNSTDNTAKTLEGLAKEPGPPLRWVTEMTPGIVPARNRCIDEAKGSKYLVFLDDDELPESRFLQAAVDAFENDGAECVGGRICVEFTPKQRPHWLEDNLLGFLAEVNYGNAPFWISDQTTPVWTANVAYRMTLFQDGLRFDHRYNREGKSIGGGEDVVMFETLLARGVRIRYRPDMAVRHFVEDRRLRRSYFLRLHYLSGRKKGLWAENTFDRMVFGVPPFLMTQMFTHWLRAVNMWIGKRPGVLRQAMNATYAMGMIEGRLRRWFAVKG